MQIVPPTTLPMRLSKWHALGNDYLLVEPGELTAPLTPGGVRRLCDYHYGVGSDGLLEVTAVDGASADVRIWNPDGSTAMCATNRSCSTSVSSRSLRPSRSISVTNASSSFRSPSAIHMPSSVANR